ncbi:hypothetical protein SEUCBS139899_009725 [Sporothrix eucalyptigena]
MSAQEQPSKSWHIFARAKEDRPTPPQVYNWKMYTCAVFIAMNILAFGYETSFIGTTQTLPSFIRDFGLDKMSTSEKSNVTGNITSFFSVGAFFGAILFFYSLEFYGRRMTVLVSDLFFIEGAVISTAASGKIGLMYAGRIISGFGMGGAVAVVPTYISEISPPAIRGRMTGLFETTYQVGSLVGFWINFGITHHVNTDDSVAWRIPMGVQLIPAGIVVIGFFFIRESPTWLLKKGRDDEAVAVLSWLRDLPADHHYIHEDVAFVKAQLTLERAIGVDDNGRFSIFGYVHSVFREAMAKGVWNRFLLVFMICMWQPWCGAFAINYYSTTIFKSIGLDNTTLWTGIYGVIKAVSAIIFFTFFIDATGRKWPWIVSCLGCCVCQFYLAGYVKIFHPATGVAHSTSADAGGKAATAMIMIVWLWSFVVTKSLPSMFTTMGYGVYIFTGIILVCAAIYAYFFIPETKGLRIDQMDQLFGGVGGQTVDYEKQLRVECVETTATDTKEIV